MLVVLQLWKEFRQHNQGWHRRMGYVAVTASALGSLSAAPYAVTYLLSARLPETVSSSDFVTDVLLFAMCVLLQGTRLLAHPAIHHVKHHGACTQMVAPSQKACPQSSLNMYAMPSFAELHCIELSSVVTMT